MPLVTVFVASEMPTDAPATPNEIAPEPTSELIVAVSAAVTLILPAAEIVAFAAALAPFEKASMVL